MGRGRGGSERQAFRILLSFSKDNNFEIHEPVNSETLVHEQKSKIIHLMHSTLCFLNFRKNKNTFNSNIALNFLDLKM